MPARTAALTITVSGGIADAGADGEIGGTRAGYGRPVRIG